VAQLRSHEIDLEARDTRVTIISFGTPALAQKWIEETQTAFQFLVDPERVVYHAFGLESSLVRSWNLRTWFTYTKLMFQGRRWRGIQGDSSQLGGDFILDQQGIIRMAYRSHDPTDRPTLKAILQALDEIEGDRNIDHQA
jgi:peroxiredoxin